MSSSASSLSNTATSYGEGSQVSDKASRDIPADDSASMSGREWTPPTWGQFAAKQIALAFVIKFLSNTALRYPYPFAPFISEELGTSQDNYNTILALGELAGLAMPLVGPLGDVYGVRNQIIAGMLLAIIGNVIISISLTLTGLLIGRIFAGLAWAIILPGMQAYISLLVSPASLGRVTGYVEYSWALSGLVGIYIAGAIIDGWSLRGSFIVMAAAMAPLVPAALLAFKSDRGHRLAGVQTDAERLAKGMARPSLGALFLSFFRSLRDVLSVKTAWGAFVVGLGMNAANNMIFLNYGVWLEEVHHYDIDSVSLTTIGIGFGEFFGTTAVTLGSDRLGLKNTVLGGLVGLFCSYIMVALVSDNVIAGLGFQYLGFLFFEISLVGSLATFSTASEPTLRANSGTFMSLYSVSFAIGRFLGAALAATLWSADGMLATGFTAAASIAPAFLSLLFLKVGQRMSTSERRASDKIIETGNIAVSSPAGRGVDTVSSDSSGASSSSSSSHSSSASDIYGSEDMGSSLSSVSDSSV